MGSSASIPERLDKDAAKELAGLAWCEESFDDLAQGGIVTRTQVLEKYGLREERGGLQQEAQVGEDADRIRILALNDLKKRLSVEEERSGLGKPASLSNDTLRMLSTSPVGLEPSARSTYTSNPVEQPILGANEHKLALEEAKAFS